jgi:Mrp family chromosome partitioning ATPase
VLAPAQPALMTVQFRPAPGGVLPRPPSARFAPELVAFHRPDHPVSEQYRALVASLLGDYPSAATGQALLFTAAAPGAGTTTVLLNAALTMARAGRQRIAVVDANLRRPAVAARLGLPDTPGLREVLAGLASLEDAVQPTGQPNLHALTAGEAVAASVVRLAGAGMRLVLRQLCQMFDHVLVDGPCWDGRPEVVALGAACDAVFLVLPEADADTPATHELLQLVPEQGALLRGCVLTTR